MERETDEKDRKVEEKKHGEPRRRRRIYFENKRELE